MSYGPPPPGNPGPPPGGGYGPPGGGYGTPPDNGLTWAIVAIFCCWPFAIPALINATKVNDLWNRGDHAGAHQAQTQAKKFTKIAFICGGILWVVVGGLYLLSAVLLVSATPTYY
ncbi:CD225/dispanin family protein [Nocardiopsis sp. CA-288880]|uniref:CD225/dispanin family protein n=1 Tax=Nocardiopsis sp. CA-288880 TaxID=3239995 RepID=UPI003D981162